MLRIDSILRDRTDRAWFCRLLRHLVRKRSRSILSTPEPAQAQYQYKGQNNKDYVSNMYD